jgi:drug/metabolite transporter (DMT)-like permease
MYGTERHPAMVVGPGNNLGALLSERFGFYNPKATALTISLPASIAGNPNPNPAGMPPIVASAGAPGWVDVNIQLRHLMFGIFIVFMAISCIAIARQWRRNDRRFLVAIVVLANVGGNTLLSAGLRDIGKMASAGEYLRALLTPNVAAGVALVGLAMFSQMALMSWADLTYVLPVTAFAYVLTAVTGKLFLNEAVPLLHWIGVVLITGGVALVGRTPPGGTEW